MSDDPIRLIDAPDPPAYLVALVRTLQPTSLPPAIRISARAGLPRPRAGSLPSWRVIGPTLAVTTLIGIGVMTWSMRETAPQEMVAREPEGGRTGAQSQTILASAADAAPVTAPATDTDTAPATDTDTAPAPDIDTLLDRAFRGAEREERRHPERYRRDSKVHAMFRRLPEAALAPDAPPPAVPERAPPSQPGDLRIPDIFLSPDSPSPPPQVADLGTGSATLIISSMPWARVYLDGRDTGLNTPARVLRVSAGRHEIGLRTPDGTMHQVRVDVVAGQTHRIVRGLTLPRVFRRGPVDEDE